ncbi:MAG: alpha-amylase [Chloroflexi bacterium]|nr:alpha-amylase [Chloroflexota bacterium]
MSSGLRRHPHLYEVNASVFLNRLSVQQGRRLTLAGIPGEEWQKLSHWGFDLVWLMGVWQRSPGARRQALVDPNLRRRYDEALPGWTAQDVAGSPYAVYGYELDASLGEEGDLMALRKALDCNGLGLVVDFVPNHMALDHPWVSLHPHRFVSGSEQQASAYPEWFFSPGDGVLLAHGRDPNFLPWTDSAQLNLFSPELRQTLTHELLRVAAVADGVRCDMAMLCLNDVFQKTWGAVLGDASRPDVEFWPDAIEMVKRKHPGFVFIAEAYWGLEPVLQGMGFDFTYDKGFYDRLRFSTPADISTGLGDAGVKQARMVRFIENHDEPRARAALGRERSMAAATILATVPGMRLFHDGQIEGRQTHLPVQLKREQDEAIDPEVVRSYERLLEISNAAVFHEGEWMPLQVSEAWECNASHLNLLAWAWRSPAHLTAVVVNYSGQRSQGRIRLPLELGGADAVALQDGIGEVTYLRDGGELRARGLYVDLEPWRAHILSARIGHMLSPS